MERLFKQGAEELFAVQYLCYRPDFAYGFARITDDEIGCFYPRHVSNLPKMVLALKSYETEYNCIPSCYSARVTRLPSLPLAIETKPLHAEITIRVNKLSVSVFIGNVSNSEVLIDAIDLKSSFEQGKLVYFPPTDYGYLLFGE